MGFSPPPPSYTSYLGTKKDPSFTKSRTCRGLKKGPILREIRNTGAAPSMYLSALPGEKSYFFSPMTCLILGYFTGKSSKPFDVKNLLLEYAATNEYV